MAQTPAAHQYSAIYKDWQLVLDQNSHSSAITYIGKDPTVGKNKPISEEKIIWLQQQLAAWKRAQIAYYSDPSVHSRFYAPRFAGSQTHLNQDDGSTVTVTESLME